MRGEVHEWRDAIYGETAAVSERPHEDIPVAQEELDPDSLLIVKWMRTAPWKYAHYSNDLDELYDLALDPWELGTWPLSPGTWTGSCRSADASSPWMAATHDPLLAQLTPGLLPATAPSVVCDGQPVSSAVSSALINEAAS